MIGSVFALVPENLRRRAPLFWTRVAACWQEPQSPANAVTVLPCPDPCCSCGVCYWEGYQDLRKVWLDDERPAPAGWIRVRTAREAIAFLALGNVTEVSLDHDLGEPAHGTGYDVLLWIEEAVALRGFSPPAIRIHSANTAARGRMELAVRSIATFLFHHFL